MKVQPHCCLNYLCIKMFFQASSRINPPQNFAFKLFTTYPRIRIMAGYAIIFMHLSLYEKLLRKCIQIHIVTKYLNLVEMVIIK